MAGKYIPAVIILQQNPKHTVQVHVYTMFDFYQKRKLKVWLSTWYVQAAAAIIMILVAYSAWQRYLIAAEMSERRAQAEAEAAELEARRDSLQQEVDYVSNERGIEAEMRRQFDVAKEGETVVVIVDEETGSKVSSDEINANEAGTTKKRWYEFWE